MLFDESDHQAAFREAMPPLKILKQLLEFRAERDWQKFHSPRNLAISLSLEAAELLEHFQWRDLPAQEIRGEKRERIEEEVADIASYLFLLCHDLGIDLSQAMERKMEINRRRYPVEYARGRSTKYDQLHATVRDMKVITREDLAREEARLEDED